MQLARAAAKSPVIVSTVARVSQAWACGKLVRTLAKGGAQHQDLAGRLGLFPPGRKGRLGIAEVARVAFEARLFDIALRQRGGQLRVGRRLSQFGAHARQLTLHRVGPRGEPLDHLLAVGRHMRHGGGGAGQRQACDQEGAAHGIPEKSWNRAARPIPAWRRAALLQRLGLGRIWRGYGNGIDIDGFLIVEQRVYTCFDIRKERIDHRRRWASVQVL
jgi:hypothetical protein